MPKNESKQPENAEDPAKKFGRTVESSLVGILKFLARFLRTVWDTFIHPSYIIAHVEYPKEEPDHARPFTFFVIACLLGGVALKHRDIESALHGHSVIASLESALQIGSPLDLLTATLPIALSLIGCALILTRYLFEEETKFDSVGVKFLCVTAGAQLVLAFMVPVSVAFYAWFKKVQVSQGYDVNATSETEVAIVLGVLYSFIAFVVLAGARPLYCYFRRDDRSGRTRSVVTAVIASVSMIFVANLATGGNRLLSGFKKLDEASIGELNEFGEVENGAIVEGKISLSTGTVQMTVLLFNKASFEQVLTPNVRSLDVRIPSADSWEAESISLIKWEGGDPVSRIAPEENTWAVVEAKGDLKLVNAIQKQYPEGVPGSIDVSFSAAFESSFPWTYEAFGNGTLKVIK